MTSPINTAAAAALDIYEVKTPMKEMVGHVKLYPVTAPQESGMIRALVDIAGSTGIVYVPAWATTTRYGKITMSSVCAHIEEWAGACLTSIRLL